MYLLRRSFTLVELLMAMTITAMLSVVLSGLVMAVQTARQHTEGLGEATLQARVAIDRIQYMVTQAGVYQLSGQPTTLGLAVVRHNWYVIELPDVLVVWSGGRTGGQAAAGLVNRKPLVRELVIYSPDPDDASRLVEIVVPNDESEIDFRDPSSLTTKILSLIRSPAADRVLICYPVRQSLLPAFAGVPSSVVGNVRFELVQTPSDAELTVVSPGTSQWYNLPWAQGIVAGDLGMRQATLRMELQIESRKPKAGSGADSPTFGFPLSASGSASTSIPFFGSASYRYGYRP